MPKTSSRSKSLLASIIIITKNQKSLLQKSLPILLNQNIKKKNYEIIAIDSGSTDGAREYVESLPIKLIKIKPKTFNFASAFNKGAKKASGKYLVRLSGDVIPIGKNWLHEMLKPLNDPTVGATYGRYTITGKKGYDYPDFWPAERFPKKITRYSIKPKPLTGVSLFNFLFGFKTRKAKDEAFNLADGCCAIRKKIWEKRPFNEKLIAAEDAEYAWFLHLIGYDIVYNPKARVIHEHKISRSIKNSFFANRGISKWGLLLSWQIARYWLLKSVGIDPCQEMRKLDFRLDN